MENPDLSSVDLHSRHITSLPELTTSFDLRKRKPAPDWSEEAPCPLKLVFACSIFTFEESMT